MAITLDRLQVIGAKRADAQNKLTQYTGELHAAVRAAFDAGLGATAIAKASGLTRARVYQIQAQKNRP